MTSIRTKIREEEDENWTKSKRIRHLHCTIPGHLALHRTSTMAVIKVSSEFKDKTGTVQIFVGCLFPRILWSGLDLTHCVCDW